MKMILPYLPFLLLVLGCSEPDHSDPFDPRIDWEKYTPVLIKDHEAPTLDGSGVRWRAEGDADKLAPLITLISKDWDRHLSCGLNPTEAKGREKPDIIFRCTTEITSRNATCGIGDAVENGAQIVLLDQKLCDSPSMGTLRHAWGHALGLDENYQYYLTIMDGHQIHFLASPSFSPIETDGLRIWSIESGAPGCGEDELDWSWNRLPDFYKSHPETSSMPKPRVPQLIDVVR